MTTYKKSNTRNKILAGSVAAVVGIGVIGYGLASLGDPGNTNIPVKNRTSTHSTYISPGKTVKPTEEKTTSTSPVKKTPTTNPKTTSSEVYYESCVDYWNSGQSTGLHRGDPGYRSDLDRDGDGTACENQG